ncbi:hypothetical protein C8Q80DRAFT_1270015 [Daedaleopsis nitida]|nr:hypothetical protein C8Q80DRAFT_1270015 [Daedaleopsis nitida]
MASAHDVEFPALLEALAGIVSHKEPGSLKVTLVDQVLASIRASSNHSAPIHKLPAEILSHIFAYVCTRRRANAESMPDHAALITITHVCRLWRTVALRYATLWSHISLHHMSALAFARRSQTALLTVIVSIRGKRWQRKMGLLRRLLPRIRTLHVTVTWMDDLLKLADTLSSQHITSLTLQVSIKRVNGRPVFLPSLGTIPPMFEGLSPSLRSLTILTNIHWCFPSGHFPGLTSLRLIHDGSLDSMSFSHLLSLLSNTPSLEDLEVRSSFPFSQSQESPSTVSEPVCLSRLRRLAIATGVLFALYSKLSMPDDAMVTLVGMPSNLPIRDPHLQPGAFTAVELLYQSRYLTFRARNAYRHLELGIHVGRAPFTERTYPRYWSAIKTLSLTVSSRTFSDSRIWDHLLSFLAHAPLLQALYIRDVNSRTITELVRVLTPTDPAPAPCPQLHTLTLSLVSPSGCLTGLTPLFRATEARARCGVPLQSLTICSPRHRTLNPANVIWNLGGEHGLEWVLLCDRDLYRLHDSDAPGDLPFCEKAARSFRRRWEARENEGADSAEDDLDDVQ